MLIEAVELVMNTIIWINWIVFLSIYTRFQLAWNYNLAIFELNQCKKRDNKIKRKKKTEILVKLSVIMTTNHMAIRRYSFIGHFRIRYYCITNIYLNLSIYFNALLGRLDIQTMLKRSTDWNVWEEIFFLGAITKYNMSVYENYAFYTLESNSKKSFPFQQKKSLLHFISS